ncbi:sperm acrosome-associated protein 7 isoform X2 [Grammomys surdaster]|uniref:sperm acrosome-associated protein 7 isoform X2 n=1 Tax=Grammomys surdaster TaxID=491861 RepID=UPI00109F5BDF|nr:sperm acrosome-associated protein 7 isoform X2 [Grammomys surdaster]
MAANRRVETFLSVFLLCCWQGTELQPVKTTSDRITEGSLNSTTENIPEALDEILAKEILEPKTSAMSETSAQPRSSIQTTVHTKDINAGIDENYQEDAFENYHEFLENSEHSSTKKEKNVKNEVRLRTFVSTALRPSLSHTCLLKKRRVQMMTCIGNCLFWTNSLKT